MRGGVGCGCGWCGLHAQGPRSPNAAAMEGIVLGRSNHGRNHKPTTPFSSSTPPCTHPCPRPQRQDTQTPVGSLFLAFRGLCRLFLGPQDSHASPPTSSRSPPPAPAPHPRLHRAHPGPSFSPRAPPLLGQGTFLLRHQAHHPSLHLAAQGLPSVPLAAGGKWGGGYETHGGGCLFDVRAVLPVLRRLPPAGTGRVQQEHVLEEQWWGAGKLLPLPSCPTLSSLPSPLPTHPPAQPHSKACGASCGSSTCSGRTWGWAWPAPCSPS